MRHRSAIAVLCLMASSAAFAGWERDATTGCEVDVPDPKLHTEVSWLGACHEGKAEGEGILSAYEIRLEGEFRRGKPFTVHGYTVYVSGDGLHTIANLSINEGGTPFVSRLAFDQDRRWVSAGYLAGDWRWESADGSCKERYEYRANFQSQTRSAAEVLEGVFELLTIPKRGTGIFELWRLALKSNGKSDCQGNASSLGRIGSVILRFVDRDTFKTCANLEESTCYGIGRRRGRSPDASIEMISRYETH